MADGLDPFQQRVGTTLRGKWTLERLIAVGGMAAVYVAVHKIGRRDAVKILRPEAMSSRELVERFEQEAHAVNHFRHPGVAEVRDFDRDENGVPFLVMELLEGESLVESALREPVPLGEALRYLDEVLDVLVAAHAQGIIHRDVKPDNLFVTREGRVKVLDFGIARMLEGSPRQHRTAAGLVIGTPEYMSPEQVLGHKADARADLYSVGATFFWLLARRHVHEARNDMEVMIKAMTQPAPPLCSAAPRVPPGVGLVIDRALKMQPDDRYPDAQTMQQDVRALRRGEAPPYASLVQESALHDGGAVTPVGAALAASPVLAAGATVGAAGPSPAAPGAPHVATGRPVQAPPRAQHSPAPPAGAATGHRPQTTLPMNYAAPRAGASAATPAAPPAMTPGAPHVLPAEPPMKALASAPPPGPQAEAPPGPAHYASAPAASVQPVATAAGTTTAAMPVHVETAPAATGALAAFAAAPAHVVVSAPAPVGVPAAVAAAFAPTAPRPNAAPADPAAPQVTPAAPALRPSSAPAAHGPAPYVTPSVPPADVARAGGAVGSAPFDGLGLNEVPMGAAPAPPKRGSAVNAFAVTEPGSATVARSRPGSFAPKTSAEFGNDELPAGVPGARRSKGGALRSVALATLGLVVLGLLGASAWLYREKLGLVTALPSPGPVATPQPSASGAALAPVRSAPAASAPRPSASGAKAPAATGVKVDKKRGNP